MLIKKTIIALGAASVVLLGSGLVGAQTATGTATTTASTNPEGAKLASSYSSFAGSQTNAESLVNGLRMGSTSITLGPSPTGPNSTAPAASFSPATGKLGYGEINIALSLAKASLAKENITNPTPAQLATALNSVLGQRSQGMGWGKIAQSMDVKLGSIVSASHTDKSGKKADHAAKADSDAKADHASKGHSSGKDADSDGKGGNAGSGGKGGGGGNAGGSGGGSGGGNGGGGGGHK